MFDVYSTILEYTKPLIWTGVGLFTGYVLSRHSNVIVAAYTAVKQTVSTAIASLTPPTPPQPIPTTPEQIIQAAIKTHDYLTQCLLTNQNFNGPFLSPPYKLVVNSFNPIDDDCIYAHVCPYDSDDMRPCVYITKVFGQYISQNLYRPQFELMTKGWTDIYNYTDMTKLAPTMPSFHVRKPGDGRYVKHSDLSPSKLAMDIQRFYKHLKDMRSTIRKFLPKTKNITFDGPVEFIFDPDDNGVKSFSFEQDRKYPPPLEYHLAQNKYKSSLGLSGVKKAREEDHIRWMNRERNMYEKPSSVAKIYSKAPEFNPSWAVEFPVDVEDVTDDITVNDPGVYCETWLNTYPALKEIINIVSPNFQSLTESEQNDVWKQHISKLLISKPSLRFLINNIRDVTMSSIQKLDKSRENFYNVVSLQNCNMKEMNFLISTVHGLTPEQRGFIYNDVRVQFAKPDVLKFSYSIPTPLPTPSQTTTTPVASQNVSFRTSGSSGSSGVDKSAFNKYPALNEIMSIVSPGFNSLDEQRQLAVWNQHISSLIGYAETASLQDYRASVAVGAAHSAQKYGVTRVNTCQPADSSFEKMSFELCVNGEPLTPEQLEDVYRSVRVKYIRPDKLVISQQPVEEKGRGFITSYF
jgi:hypothetical protein